MTLGVLLTVVFLVMKLAAIGAVATWSWWLVFLPVMIEVVVDALIFIFAWSAVMNAFSGRGNSGLTRRRGSRRL